MGSLGCPCYRPLGWMNLAPILGRARSPGVLLGQLINLLLILLLGLGKWARAPIFKPDQLPPSPWLRRAWARAVSFLELSATSTCSLTTGLVRDLSLSNVLWY